MVRLINQESVQTIEHATCPAPAVAALITSYCFGDVTEAQRAALETHLLECDRCWEEVACLERAVRKTRTDHTLLSSLTSRDVIAVLGISATLERPFGGHGVHVVVASTLFSLLFAVPVCVELAYGWNSYGRLAAVLAPLVFSWMLLLTMLALWTAARSARQGRVGLAQALAVMSGAATAVAAVLVSVLPHTANVQAAIQTYPVHLGYLKSVFYALLVGPVFVAWTFTFVLAMQRELQRGAHRQVLGVLDGTAGHLPPRGVVFPRLWTLGVYLAVLFLFHVLGVSHLFDHLTDGPHANLFRALVMLRVGLSLLLPVWCLWWYATTLNDLRRECLAVISLDATRPPHAAFSAGPHT